LDVLHDVDDLVLQAGDRVGDGLHQGETPWAGLLGGVLSKSSNATFVKRLLPLSSVSFVTPGHSWPRLGVLPR
jgi:hypothetical protein